MPSSTVEGFAADLVALVNTTGRQILGGGPYGYRVELVRSDERAFAAVDNQSRGGMTLRILEQPPWSRSVRRFRPATGVIITPTDVKD